MCKCNPNIRSIYCSKCDPRQPKITKGYEVILKLLNIGGINDISIKINGVEYNNNDIEWNDVIINSDKITFMIPHLETNQEYIQRRGDNFGVY
jgi:hypothetical protein